MARKIGSNDLDDIAANIVSIFHERKHAPKRKELERKWQEVDRQVAVRPIPRNPRDSGGRSTGWLPELEMPDQAWALEVLLADTRRLIFPPGQEWFQPHAAFTDKLGQALESFSLQHGDDDQTELGLGNQEAADIILKSVHDYYHRAYDFRRRWDKVLTGAFLYGSYVGRVIPVRTPKLDSDWRGIKSKKPRPELIPYSVRNVYFDDSSQTVLQEGMVIQPSFIREYWQHITDVRKAAAKGNGWFTKEVHRLEKTVGEGEGDDKKDHVHLLEFEGDIVIPRAGNETIFLPNRIVTVAPDHGPRTVRMQDFPFPFRSYITGVYQEDDAESPYGSSPLLKGVTLQRWASEAANWLSEAAALHARPPIVWQPDDVNLSAEGGPAMEPGAVFRADNPENVKQLVTGDPKALLAFFIGVSQKFVDLMGLSEPRKSGEVKSHTSATAADVGLSRGVLRTEDFANGIEQGALSTMLYMEFAMAKRFVGQNLTVLMDMNGAKQHIDVSSDMLPKMADYTVMGSRGALSKRERRENAVALYQLMLNTEPLAIQAGATPLDIDAFRRFLFGEYGVSDADRFFRTTSGAAQGTPPGQDISGRDGGDIESITQLADLQTG